MDEGGVWLAGYYWVIVAAAAAAATGHCWWAAVVKRVSQKPRQSPNADTHPHVFLSFSYFRQQNVSGIKISHNIWYWIQCAWICIRPTHCLLFLSKINLEEVGLKTDTSTNMVFSCVGQSVRRPNTRIKWQNFLKCAHKSTLNSKFGRFSLSAWSLRSIFGKGAPQRYVDTSGQIYLMKKGGLYNGRAVTRKVTPRLFGADRQIRCLLLSQLVNPLHIESQTGGACTS